MKKLLFIVLTVLVSKGFAQKVENISVKGSEVWAFVEKENYKYPDFRRARVYFKNNDSAGGKMNYNYLLQTMQFINAPAKDTLVVNDESSIKYIAIGLDSFFYDNGFYEWAASTSKSKLLIKRSLKLLEGTQMVGAYGIASPSQNIKSQDAFRGWIGTAKIGVDEEYQFVKETGYYIKVGKKEPVLFTKKNIEELYPKKEDQIEEYIKQYKINFNKEADIVDLYAFINQP